MKNTRFDWRLAVLPLTLLAFLAAPLSASADWWMDDDEHADDFGVDDDWVGTDYEYSFENDDEWWEDAQYAYEDAGYDQDQYGYYDTDYDWDTDDGWFDDWF